MTIEIELKPDEEHLLRERARQTGRALSDDIHQVLKEHITAPAKSLAEVLVPVEKA